MAREEVCPEHCDHASKSIPKLNARTWVETSRYQRPGTIVGSQEESGGTTGSRWRTCRRYRGRRRAVQQFSKRFEERYSAPARAGRCGWPGNVVCPATACRPSSRLAAPQALDPGDFARLPQSRGLGTDYPDRIPRSSERQSASAVMCLRRIQRDTRKMKVIPHRAVRAAEEIKLLRVVPAAGYRRRQR